MTTTDIALEGLRRGLLGERLENYVNEQHFFLTGRRNLSSYELQAAIREAQAQNTESRPE